MAVILAKELDRVNNRSNILACAEEGRVIEEWAADLGFTVRWDLGSDRPPQCIHYLGGSRFEIVDDDMAVAFALRFG